MRPDAQTPAGSPAATPATTPAKVQAYADTNGLPPDSTVGGTTSPQASPAPADQSLPRFTILNWTNAYGIEVEASEAHGRVPSLVRLCSRDLGPVTFQHSMTPLQARQLAAQLMLCADAADGQHATAGIQRSTPHADLIVETVELEDCDKLEVGVPYFEAISLELIDATKQLRPEYIEIPLHHVEAVIKAMQVAAGYAAVDARWPR